MFGHEEVLKKQEIRESKAISKCNKCEVFKIKADQYMRILYSNEYLKESIRVTNE